jgi:hypothetical protein
VSVGSKSRPTGPSQAVVGAVLERASYQCEINGCDLGDRRGIDWSIQHRRSRGAGSTRHPRVNGPSNLLVCCGSGTTGCHGAIENALRAAAYEVGWLVRKCDCPRPFDCVHSPAKTPVLILRHRWVLLDEAAQYIDVEAPAEVPDGG